MRSLIFVSMVCLLLTSVAGADEARRAKDIKPDEIVRSAKAMGQALVKQDFDQFVNFTFPKIVENLHGRQKMIEMLKTGTAEMKKNGYAILSNHVDPPTVIVDAADDIVSIVPEMLVLTVPGGTLTTKSYFIAVSSDHGATWTFIQGTDINETSVKTLLPNFPGTIKLPEKQTAIFTPDK